MYEIDTLLLLPLKIYLIVLKHIKSLILLKKLVFISNFNVFILMFVICFLFYLNSLDLAFIGVTTYKLFSYPIHHINLEWH